MKRFLGVMTAILCLLIPICGQAEIGCICDEERCICFIQLGDTGLAVRGSRQLLVEKGYLKKSRVVQLFDEEMQRAVLQFQMDHDLPETGVLDDGTLTCLIWGMTAAALDDERPDLAADSVWVPTDGGIRWHMDPDCRSGMKAPRRISVRNACALKIRYCGICSAVLPWILE